MEKYDVAIIGGGPGGLTAAIYASRANLSTVFIEKGAPGGKVVKTQKIENWTGDQSVNGPELAMRMFEHATKFGAKYHYGEVLKVDSKNANHQVITLKDNSVIEAKKVIIATGMVENIPRSVKNIERFENQGVSYCAICDGPLHKGADIAVIGGGNAAIEEAYYLSTVGKSVTVFVRVAEELIAEKKLIEELKHKKNVEIIIGGEILELIGQNKVEKIKAKINGEIKELAITAVFPYIGQKPVSSFVEHLKVTNKQGYILTDENMETKVTGIFAIGDIRQKNIRQIATAVADGAIAGKIVANNL